MLSAPRKKSDTTSWPLASCTAKVGMVHTNATHGKTVFELSFTVCVSTLRGHSHVEDETLRVCILVRVPSSMVLRVCGSACVCVRLCACGRACLPVMQDEILEVLVVEEPAGVLVTCFVSPLHDAKVWKSTLQSLNSARGLCMCGMCGKCLSESST